MPRRRYKLKVIRFRQRRESGIYQRRLQEDLINSKKELTNVLKSTKNDDRLWVSVTSDYEPGGALWVAITGDTSWITYWVDGDSVDTHAFNGAKSDADRYIEFLLDNTQPQMVRESFTFSRKTALDALGYFVVHGSPPDSLAFIEDLDTFC